MTFSTKLGGRIVLGAALATASIAVAQNKVPAASPTKPVVAPAATPADDAQAAALFEKTCSGCHETAQATSQQKDAAGWQETVERMMAYGAPLSGDDATRIAKYLAVHHGPAAKK